MKSKIDKLTTQLPTPRVFITIYNDNIRTLSEDGKHSWPLSTGCFNVSLALAIQILKFHGVNLRCLGKKYKNRENTMQSWLDVTQKLNLATRIDICDEYTGEILFHITSK